MTSAGYLILPPTGMPGSPQPSGTWILATGIHNLTRYRAALVELNQLPCVWDGRMSESTGDTVGA